MDAIVREFLAGRHVAVLGTTNRDGSVHLANVWYLLEGDFVYMQTADSTVKAKNVVRTRTASLVVDSRGRRAWRGASTSGPAQLITEPGEVQPLRERIMARYMTAQGMADPRVGGRMRVGDNSIIRLTPTKWKWWSVDEMFSNEIRDGYMLPLSD
ncbi:MAG: hypothetical protein QOJ19_2250 [Acidimicrobiia bacterium]|jgi:PPOX class probable F420-dependent enzyme|nr:hypothetical protein [Acidimicrobiia bacterium]